jgi:ABC-2 type transport system ATP-binding protein
MVVVENVFKSTGPKQLLSDICLSVGSGEIVCLLGPNGAGKSTLMRTLLGLIKPTSGCVRLFGADPWVDGPNVRARCGVVPEDDLFYDDETALSNLLLWASLHGIKRRQAMQGIEVLASRFALQDDLSEKVATYSKGMKRRLSLIRALMKEAELLLFDEPTSGLDINARTELREIVRQRVHEDHCGAIICSHELDEVRRLEPTVKILVCGEVAAEITSGNGEMIEAAYLEALDRAGVGIRPR